MKYGHKVLEFALIYLNLKIMNYKIFFTIDITKKEKLKIERLARKRKFYEKENSSNKVTSSPIVRQPFGRWSRSWRERKDRMI